MPLEHEVREGKSEERRRRWRNVNDRRGGPHLIVDATASIVHNRPDGVMAFLRENEHITPTPKRGKRPEIRH